ncbi:hypothetical protein ElyMa_006309000 [Elysia marginata]|uniref:Uncharacterized protein n=1 Tax=Elysia marginata TaxID=1093978 RepID=A0AAV4HIH1_9GAST|nr:hypothetical protein ElyMa_006309000 [Elysia marginata]
MGHDGLFGESLVGWLNFNKFISETALKTSESVLPHCDVRSAAYTTPSHIILTQGRPDLALNPLCQTPGGSASNTNFKVLGLTRPGIEPVPPDLCASVFTARPQSWYLVKEKSN